MKFLLASNNVHKLKELQRILSPLGITVVTPKDMKISLDDVEENGTTFAENAKIKAMAAFNATGLPSIADDTGLCVDALGGAPGVYTARYAGKGATDEDKYNKLLNAMKDIPEENRTAHFTTSICCILDKDNIITVDGIANGKISFQPIGNFGFGYDSVFICELDKTFACLNDEEKDSVSHRGKALRLLAEKLKNYI